MDTLIKSGVAPDKLLYVSFDHPLLKFCTIQEVMDNFHNNIQPEKDVYYFFDEIQYADDWDMWLKTVYDANPKIKIMATGSASPKIEDKKSDSGVGRWTVIKVPTLTFYEYCELLEIEKPIDARPTLEGLLKMSLPEQNRLFLKLKDLEKYFNRYLMFGGFPEFALAKDDTRIPQLMREDIVDKVLKRDIPALFKVQSIYDLERIFLYLCYHSSSIINLDTMTKELNGVSRPTLEKYIDYLIKSNLISLSKQVDSTGKKALKSQPKIYIADSGVRNSVIMNTDILINPTEMGIIAETAIFNHVANYYKNAEIGYLRDKKKEIDMVVVDNFKTRILIEVKYRESYDLEGEAITRLATEDNMSFLITKKGDDYGRLNLNKNIYRIPAFAFMYLVG